MQKKVLMSLLNMSGPSSNICLLLYMRIMTVLESLNPIIIPEQLTNTLLPWNCSYTKGQCESDNFTPNHAISYGCRFFHIAIYNRHGISQSYSHKISQSYSHKISPENFHCLPFYRSKTKKRRKAR